MEHGVVWCGVNGNIKGRGKKKYPLLMSSSV